MKTLVALLALALLCLPAAALAYGPGYQYQSPYYPTQYIGPARTGLPAYGYFYPNEYRGNWRSFSQYRAYTHEAYRHYNQLIFITPDGTPLPRWDR